MPLDTVNIATFILDDDQDDLDIIKEVIESLGITNYKLFIDEDAFMMGLNEEIHVCVIDHFLTKRTGLDILYEIKKRNEGSFVIGYSAISDAGVIIDYLNGDLDRFVDKTDKQHIAKLQKHLTEGLEIAHRRIKFMKFIRSEKEKLNTDEPSTG